MRASFLAFAIFLTVRAVVASDPAAADAAFAAGDNAKALALYDEVLSGSPDDVHALIRSGMLLSWDRRYVEAIARYDQALALDPKNRDARLERAKVMLWSRRYDEAGKAFTGILADDPADREARLSLARAYSWDARQQEARAEYQRVLDSNANDPAALLGVAQTYAWSGQGAAARPWYERALAAKPGMKEAEVGLAYLDLEAGDTSAALERSQALAATYPEDADVKALQAAVAKARAPWVSIGYDHLGDTDDNRLDTLRLEGGFGLPARFDLKFGISGSDLDGLALSGTAGDGKVETLYGVLGWKPKPRHRAELRAGAARVTDSLDRERTTAIGGLTYNFPMGTWTGRAAATYDPFLYSPAILDAEIDVATVSFGGWGRIGSRVHIDASANYGDFSDGNGRTGGEAGCWYVWTRPKNTTLLGGVVRAMRFSDDLDNGYFDPQRFWAPVGSLRSYGSIGASKWTYEGTLEAGTQWFEVNGAEATNQPLVNLFALVGRPLPHGMGLEIWGGWSNSSTAAGPDFRSLNYGARLRFTIGG